LTESEFAEWWEFYNREPWGWEARCFSSGIVAATIANIYRDTKKKPRPFEAIDFVPGAKRTPKKIDPKALKAQLQLTHAGMLRAGNNKLQHKGREGYGKSPKATRPQARVKGRRPKPKSGGKADSGRSQKASSNPKRGVTPVDNGGDKQ
jgi:hypothetical protein